MMECEMCCCCRTRAFFRLEKSLRFSRVGRPRVLPCPRFTTEHFTAQLKLNNSQSRLVAARLPLKGLPTVFIDSSQLATTDEESHSPSSVSFSQKPENCCWAPRPTTNFALTFTVILRLDIRPNLAQSSLASTLYVQFNLAKFFVVVQITPALPDQTTICRNRDQTTTHINSHPIPSSRSARQS